MQHPKQALLNAHYTVLCAWSLGFRVHLTPIQLQKHSQMLTLFKGQFKNQNVCNAILMDFVTNLIEMLHFPTILASLSKIADYIFSQFLRACFSPVSQCVPNTQ